jgi:hypothetical protein
VELVATQQLTGAPDTFGLENDPGLTKAISESLAEEVQKMKSERSVAGIAAVLESLAAADLMGFDAVRPGEATSAFEAAKTLAEQLLKHAETRVRPGSPVLDTNLMKRRGLVQLLGG